MALNKALLNLFLAILVTSSLTVGLQEVNIANIEEVSGDPDDFLQSYYLRSIRKLNIGRIGKMKLKKSFENILNLPKYCNRMEKKFSKGFTAVLVDKSGRKCFPVSMGYVAVSKGYVSSSFNSSRKRRGKQGGNFTRSKNLKNRNLPLFSAKAKTGFSIEAFYRGLADTVFMSEWSPYGNSYKSPLMDNWSNLGFQQINFTLFRNGSLQSYLVFNATGSNFTNWFHNSRLIYSYPWNITALKAFPDWFIFSVDGYNKKGAVRSFHSERGRYRGCDNDDGLTMIMEDLPDNCQKQFFNDRMYVPSRIIWSYNNKTGGPGRFGDQTQTKEADELRIDGIINRDILLYQ